MLTLHPRSTADTDPDRITALSAPTADPLWFLARQWQTGGFIADDAGTPVTVQLATTVAPLILARSPLTGPAEALIEAEPAGDLNDADTAIRTRVASELFRRLADGGLPDDTITTARQVWTATYPLATINAGAPCAALAGHCPDPAAIVTVLAAALAPDGTGTFPTLPGMPADPAQRSTAETAMRGWYTWVLGQFAASSGDPTPPHWDTTRLAYQAALTATTSAGTLTLTAADYDGTGLDWHSFDRSTLPGPPAATTATVTVRPTPISYPGMPQPGYWTLEDGDVHLDPAVATDPAQQLLVTFAHAYANDWFLIPLTVPPGICLISTLQVTDTFGTTTTVPASAALDGPYSRWALWEMTPTTTTTADGAAGLRMFLPPAPPPLHGPDLEDLLVARDELANLGWVIELTTRDDDGTTIDRYHRWLTRRSAQDPSYNPGTPDAASWYRLGTTLPDHWYPLTLDPAATADLTLAGLPDGATDVSDAGVRGHLFPHQAGTRLAGEQLTRMGIQVSWQYRLTYPRTGRTLWRARTRGPGRGESSSGLRFDVLAGPATPQSLTHSADLGPALRTPPPPLTGTGSGSSPLHDWWLVNQHDATTRAWLEPTSRPGGWGWMLHLATTADSCGLAQQWEATGSGPAHATVQAWIYVISGQVRAGAGNGDDIGDDVISASTQRWELLNGPATRSPVNQVIVTAHGGPAEFLLDSVQVFPTAGSA